MSQAPHAVTPRLVPAAIRKYWPGLADGQLAPAYAGIRPKLAGPGQPGADFVVQARSSQQWPPCQGNHCHAARAVLRMLLCSAPLSMHCCGVHTRTCCTVQGPAQHGVPGLVNLFGIESPGLTSSLAIAEMVAQSLDSSTPSAKL
jgi:L-2-hydroxyglutarate oxidase LhgO